MSAARRFFGGIVADSSVMTGCDFGAAGILHRRSPGLFHFRSGLWSSFPRVGRAAVLCALPERGKQVFAVLKDVPPPLGRWPGVGLHPEHRVPVCRGGQRARVATATDRPAHAPLRPAPRLGCAHDSVNEVRALFIHASPAQCSCSSAPCKGRSHWKKYQPNFRQPKQNQNQTKVSGMCFYHVGRPVRGGNATKPSWDIPGLVSYPYHSDQAD